MSAPRSRARAVIAALALLSLACSGTRAERAAEPVAASEPRQGEPYGWYELAPDHHLLIARGPDGGARALDFDTPAFAALEQDGAGGYLWRVDGVARSVRFELDERGFARALAWSDETGGGARLPRAAHPPFAVEEIAFDSGGIALEGVLMSPRVAAERSAPGAVIVHGSGESDRDNVWAYHIAQHLARNGIVVLLADKRGSGASGGDWRTADFDDLARDAAAGAERLRADPRVDPARVGFVGLSQGGWIAPFAAGRDPRIAFAVGVSAAAVPVREQLRHEIRQDLAREGVAEADVQRAMRLFELADRHAAEPTDASWAAYVAGREELAAGPLAPFADALPRERTDWWWTWWNGVRAFDPLPHWRALGAPSLVVYGADDETDNVPVAESVRRLRELARGDLTVRVYEGSSHALADESGWIRPDFLAELSAWIAAAPPAGGAK